VDHCAVASRDGGLLTGASTRTCYGATTSHSGQLARDQVGKLLVHGDVGAQNRQVRVYLRKELAATEALVEVDPIAVLSKTQAEDDPQRVARNPRSGESRPWGCAEMDRWTFSVALLGLALRDKIAGRNEPMAALPCAATGGRLLRRRPANQIGVEACR
jgi:hypothetical protein